MNSNRRRMLAAMAGMAGMTAFPFARGNTGAWPDRPIRLILPYAASGPTDVVARRIAARLAERLAETFRAANPGVAVKLNAPYHVDDVSDFTIPVHGERRGIPHVLVEVRDAVLALGLVGGAHLRPDLELGDGSEMARAEQDGEAVREPVQRRRERQGRAG